MKMTKKEVEVKRRSQMKMERKKENNDRKEDGKLNARLYFRPRNILHPEFNTTVNNENKRNFERRSKIEPSLNNQRGTGHSHKSRKVNKNIEVFLLGSTVNQQKWSYNLTELTPFCLSAEYFLPMFLKSFSTFGYNMANLSRLRMCQIN